MRLTSWFSQPTIVRKIAFSQAEQAITCLAILLANYGYMVTASEIRRGRKLSQCQYDKLDLLANELGFTLIETTVGIIEALSNNKRSMIVNLDNQGSVILSMKGRDIWLNNPYTGIRKINDVEKKLLLFQTKGLIVDESKLTPKLKRIKPSFLWSLLLSDRSLYAVGAVIVLLSLMHGLVVLMDPIIKNIYFTNVVQMGITDWARTLAIVYFLVAVSGGVLLLAGSALSLMLTSRLSLKWSFNTFTALLRLPIEYLKMRSRGDLMNRVRSSESLGNFIGSDEIILIGSALNLGLLLVVLLSTSIPLALTLLCLQVLSLLFIVKVNGGWKTRSDSLQQQSALETGSFVNLIGNVHLLRQQKLAVNAFRIHQLAVNRRTRAQQKMSIYTILVHFGTTTIDTLQSAVLLTMAALLIMDGQISLGEYVAFQAIIGSVIAPVKKAASFISNIQTLRATHDRILDVIEESTLQEKHGIGDSIESDQLIKIEITGDSRPNHSRENPEASPKTVLNITKEMDSVCLMVKNLEQKIYLEAVISGERLVADNVKLNIAHNDGSRELVIARSSPYLYPTSIKENITLGYPSGRKSPFKEINELVSMVGWRPERLANDIQELAGNELEMQRLSMMRALWRGGTGILFGDDETARNSEKINELRQLITKISTRGITVIVLTTGAKEYNNICTQSIEVAPIIEAMMIAEQKWMQE